MKLLKVENQAAEATRPTIQRLCPSLKEVYGRVEEAMVHDVTSLAVCNLRLVALRGQLQSTLFV